MNTVKCFSMTAIKTEEQTPQIDQRVMYYFEPFEHWYIGIWYGSCFFGRSGFCDKYDAPYWMTETPDPRS